MHQMHRIRTRFARDSVISKRYWRRSKENSFQKDYEINGRSAGFQPACFLAITPFRTCRLEARGPAVCSVISLLFPTFRAIEDHPDSEILGEVFEAVLASRWREDQITGAKTAASGAIEIDSSPLC